MRIREKKIGTLSTEIGPAATKIVKFWPKKAYLSMGANFFFTDPHYYGNKA